MSRWNSIDADEWRLDVAYELGEADTDDVLDVVGRDWSGDDTAFAICHGCSCPVPQDDAHRDGDGELYHPDFPHCLPTTGGEQR